MRQPDHPTKYRAAERGDLAAEALTTTDRGRLLWRLYGAGMSPAEIARHTRTTLFTTDRIIQRQAFLALVEQAEKLIPDEDWEGVA